MCEIAFAYKYLCSNLLYKLYLINDRFVQVVKELDLLKKWLEVQSLILKYEENLIGTWKPSLCIVTQKIELYLPDNLN